MLPGRSEHERRIVNTVRYYGRICLSILERFTRFEFQFGIHIAGEMRGTQSEQIYVGDSIRRVIVSLHHSPCEGFPFIVTV